MSRLKNLPKLQAEPPQIRSQDELAAAAASLARELIARYDAQARRMRDAGAGTLAAAYDELALQQRELVFAAPAEDAAPAPPPAVVRLPDDEGTDTAAVELLDPYRIFAVAVRNSERAFAFWSYVAAQAPEPAIRAAAEKLAGDELARAAWLRRRRRASYHARDPFADGYPAVPEAMEQRFADLLEGRRDSADDDALRRQLAGFAGQARERAAQLARSPFDASLPSLRRPPVVPAAAWSNAAPLCEALLDRYLELAGETQDEGLRDRTHVFAAELLACFRFLRSR